MNHITELPFKRISFLLIVSSSSSSFVLLNERSSEMSENENCCHNLHGDFGGQQCNDKFDNKLFGNSFFVVIRSVLCRNVMGAV